MQVNKYYKCKQTGVTFHHSELVKLLRSNIDFELEYLDKDRKWVRNEINRLNNILLLTDDELIDKACYPISPNCQHSYEEIVKNAND